MNTTLFGNAFMEDSELSGEVFKTKDLREAVVKKGRGGDGFRTG
jgi:hypothetical protein